MQIVVFGNASKKVVKEITTSNEDQEKTLMEILILNDIPIASSCSGDGVCKKCIINDSVLSCDITVKEFIKEFGNKIIVNYL